MDQGKHQKPAKATKLPHRLVYPPNSSELGLLLPASGLNPRVFKNFRPLCPLGALFRSPSLCFQPFAASFPKTRGGGTLWRSNVSTCPFHPRVSTCRPD